MNTEQEHLLERLARGYSDAFARLAEPCRTKVRREGRRALHECLRGRGPGRGLSREALRYAVGHMSEDARGYTECERVLQRAEFRRRRRPPSGRHGHPTDPQADRVPWLPGS
jgi:predicted GNAT family N-acyltransferase